MYSTQEVHFYSLNGDGVLTEWVYVGRENFRKQYQKGLFSFMLELKKNRVLMKDELYCSGRKRQICKDKTEVEIARLRVKTDSHLLAPISTNINQKGRESSISRTASLRVRDTKLLPELRFPSSVVNILFTLRVRGSKFPPELRFPPPVHLHFHCQWTQIVVLKS